MSMNKKIEEALQFRYATKAYDSDYRLKEEDKETLYQSLLMSPSSFGIQPYHFVVVRNTETRKLLREVAFNQSPVSDSSELVVFCARNNLIEKDIIDFVELTATTRGQEIESLDSYKNMMVGALLGQSKEDLYHWSAKQVYIAMGMFLETAALLEVDATPMEGFDKEAVTRILKLEEKGYKAVAICAIGKRSAEDKYQNLKKVRKEKKEIMSFVD